MKKINELRTSQVASAMAVAQWCGSHSPEDAMPAEIVAGIMRQLDEKVKISEKVAAMFVQGVK